MNKTMLYRLSHTPNPTNRDPGNIAVFRGDRPSIHDMVRDLYDNDPQTLAFYEHYFEQGFEPWIARKDGIVVGVVWLFPDSYLLMWEGYDAWLLRFHAKPGTRFVGNVFVSPQRRGQGIFPLIAKSCFTTYPEADFYSTIDAENDPSLRSHEKIGFQPCGSIRYIRFFQWTFCFVALKRNKFAFYHLRKGRETDIVLNT